MFYNLAKGHTLPLFTLMSPGQHDASGCMQTPAQHKQAVCVASAHTDAMFLVPLACMRLMLA